MSENKHVDPAKGTPLSEYRPLPRPDLSDSEWISNKSLPRPEPEKVSDSMIEDVYISIELPDGLPYGVEIVEYPYPIEAIEIRKWSDYAPKGEEDER